MSGLMHAYAAVSFHVISSPLYAVLLCQLARAQHDSLLQGGLLLAVYANGLLLSAQGNSYKGSKCNMKRIALFNLTTISCTG